MISAAIDAGNLMDYAEDAVGELINAISSRNYMDCADITVSDDAADVWIDCYRC